MNWFYYRISDNSYRKEKLPGADKEFCLRNCLEVFKSHWQPYDMKLGSYDRIKRPTRFRIIADNVTSEDTKRMIEKVSDEYQVPVLHTTKGNAGSIRWAIKNAIQELDPYDRVYFVEDDYLHHPRASELLTDGFTVGADYVTLFDHPDKYSKLYEFGETCKVYRTEKSHWRDTQSTCMTFAAGVDVLKEDLDVWEKWTENSHPEDHAVFSELRDRGRKLVVPIPGAAVHTDLTVSICLANVLIEPWAMEMASTNLERKLRLVNDEGVQETLGTILSNNHQGWNKLKLLQALWVSVKDFEAIAA